MYFNLDIEASSFRRKPYRKQQDTLGHSDVFRNNPIFLELASCLQTTVAFTETLTAN